MWSSFLRKLAWACDIIYIYIFIYKCIEIWSIFIIAAPLILSSLLCTKHYQICLTFLIQQRAWSFQKIYHNPLIYKCEVAFCTYISTIIHNFLVRRLSEILTLYHFSSIKLVLLSYYWLDSNEKRCVWFSLIFPTWY